jgi:hypothetical protein
MQSMLLPNEHLTCYIVTSRFCGVSIQMYVKTYGKSFLLHSEKKKRIRTYPIMAHHPEARLSILLALRPLGMADHVRSMLSVGLC